MNMPNNRAGHTDAVVGGFCFGDGFGNINQGLGVLDVIDIDFEQEGVITQNGVAA